MQHCCVNFFLGHFLSSPNIAEHFVEFCCVFWKLDNWSVIKFLFHGNGEMRAVNLNIYYMRNSLTAIIQNGIPPNCNWGKMKKAPDNIFDQESFSSDRAN